MCQRDMAKVVEADEHIKLSEQLEEDIGPVVLMDKFNVKPEEADQFLKALERMLHILRASPDLFQCSSIEELEVVVYSLIIKFGNLLHCSRRLLAKLTCRNYYRIIPTAQSYHLKYSRRLQYQESVWTIFMTIEISTLVPNLNLKTEILSTIPGPFTLLRVIL
jgi:hypothetical protein